MTASPPSTNALGQPIGAPLPGWAGARRPARTRLAGRFCMVEPLDLARHAGALYAACAQDRDGRMWTYLASGPFETEAGFRSWLEPRVGSDDPLFFAIVDAASGRAMGLAAYLRIDAPHGVIEVGHLTFAPPLQRTPAATEAMYLMMMNAFALGYRRYEWKCDALNQASRRAAERLGFRYEGTFRQATIYKGRNRDTAWYSVVDREWPALAAAFECWLDPANFDPAGRQRTRLGDRTRAAQS